jgi:protein O-mannosyl-transferase
MSDSSSAPAGERSRGPSAGWVLGALVVLVVAAYWPVFRHEFVAWDDTYYLLVNPRMNPPRLSEVGYYWRHSFMELYIPVTYTLWTLVGLAAWTSDGRGGAELNPYVFHAANLALHSAAAGMAWAVLHRLTRDRVAAAVGAAVLAVHPLMVEEVAWASGFRDMLGELFSLTAIYCYLRSESAEAAKRAWSWYAAATAAYTLAVLSLAVLSTPASVAVLLGTGALAVWAMGRGIRRTASRLGPWLLIAACVVLTTRHVQHPPGPQDIPPIWIRPLIAGDALAFYLGKLVVPVSMCVHYGRTPSSVLESGVAWKTSLVTAAVAATRA